MEGATLAEGPLMQGFIPLSEYQAVVDMLLANQAEILAELQALLSHSDSGKQWAVWAGPGHNPPCFTKLSTNDILQRQQSNLRDPTDAEFWTLYGLILYGKPVPRGAHTCPTTYSLCKQIPGLVNAGFSCLGPHAQTGWHEDMDRGFDRLHLALVIPEGECVFQVGSETKMWANDPVICFNDTRRHNARNATDYPRFVLLVDVYRSPGRKKAIRQARQLAKAAAKQEETQAMPKQQQIVSSTMETLLKPVSSEERNKEFRPSQQSHKLATSSRPPKV